MIVDSSGMPVSAEGGLIQSPSNPESGKRDKVEISFNQLANNIIAQYVQQLFQRGLAVVPVDFVNRSGNLLLAALNSETVTDADLKAQIKQLLDEFTAQEPETPAETSNATS